MALLKKKVHIVVANDMEAGTTRLIGAYSNKRKAETEAHRERQASGDLVDVLTLVLDDSGEEEPNDGDSE